MPPVVAAVAAIVANVSAFTGVSAAIVSGISENESREDGWPEISETENHARD